MSTSLAQYPQPRPLPTIVLARDVDPARLRAMVRSGELERPSWGVYVAPEQGMRWARDIQFALAIVAATRRQLPLEGVVSHASAALLHGLWVGPWDGLTHVTTPTRPSRQRAGLRRHVASLADDDVVEINGILVTNLMRTILDCARVLPPRWGLSVADSGLRALVRPDRRRPQEARAATEALRAQLLDALEKWRRSPGVARARAVIVAAQALVESAGESGLRWVIVSRGLPAPELQIQVVVNGRVYYIDLGWRVERTSGAGTRERILIGEEYDGE